MGVIMAALYARYSSDNQRDESIDAQIRAGEEYAERNNMKIVKQYVDKAKSATTDKRPAFQEMIKDSSLGLFNTVIVHKLDRFSRDKYDSVVYKRKLKSNGVRLVSIVENLDGSPESIILESVIEGMAQYYSANLAREVMKGMKETAYQARHTGGQPPLGYDVNEEKKYIINDAGAEVVRKIFDMYINGYSYASIIDNLNDRGYKTRLGNSFGKNSIYSILDNEKYSGVYIFNKTSKKDAFGKRNSHLSKDDSEVIRVDGGMPAIISKETYQKAKEMMVARKRAPGANKAKEIYLLSGLIFCGECGSAMQGNRRKPVNKPMYISYRCGSRLQKRNCDNKEIRREYIEEFVLSELERNILNDKAIPIFVKKINKHIQEQSKNEKSSTEIIVKELEGIDKQISNIVTAITQGFAYEEFKTKMVDLKERKTKLEVTLIEQEHRSQAPKITEEQVKNLFLMFRGFVKERNMPECKKFIQNYVDKVIIFKDHVEVIFNVVFTILKDYDAYKIKSSANKTTLVNRYRNIA
ncbi:recombinase family protein [Clostridium estertheticum]|uniref:recombinase family protein n=1 Tax=Clostridium estertheticum TaxID=238834 RepID=UPI001CF1D45C|nr:recombinase family protein [Clostridium estertheticum]MCB2354716.1 recombinase family protein [Clostridium estertheticum]WAG40958.1 recombinase family protein [Clostridium estertheticum]